MTTKIDNKLFINNPHLTIDSFEVDRNVTTAEAFTTVLCNHGITQVKHKLRDAGEYGTSQYMYIVFDSNDDTIPTSVNIEDTNTPVFTLTIEDYTQLLGFCKLFGDSKGTQIFLEDWITRDGNIIRAGAYAI